MRRWQPSSEIQKFHADHLKRRTIAVHPGELIVGSNTEHRMGAICHIEKAGSAISFPRCNCGHPPAKPGIAGREPTISLRRDQRS